MPGDTNANVNGAGQAVNVHLGEGARLFYAFLVLLALCLVASTYAVIKASEINDLKTEFRLVQYWAERVEVAAEKQGIKLPPLPQSAHKQ